MKIAVLSGKGGTGKTLVSVNLAVTMGMEKPRNNNSGRALYNPAAYVDCDVEEPNGRLFFKPENVTESPVSVKVPGVDSSLCNGCRKCISFCKFNALALIKDKVLIFDEVCHSCGGCSLICPEKAIAEKDRSIGKIEKGIFEINNNAVNVYTGILNTGEVSGVPIIRELLKVSGVKDKSTSDAVIDCPPGSACVVMESISEADYCILVAEPTIFGVHNLNMVYELVTMFGKKFGVVLNKCIEGTNPAEAFCNEHKIDIIGRIPFDKDLGLINSNGGIVSVNNKAYKELFAGILNNIKKMC